MVFVDADNLVVAECPFGNLAVDCLADNFALDFFVDILVVEECLVDNLEVVAVDNFAGNLVGNLVVDTTAAACTDSEDSTDCGSPIAADPK